MSQLPLTCATPNKRPRQITEAMALAAAEEIVAKLADVGEKAKAAADVVAVTSCDRSMDGYQIARELERQKHWTCDMEIAEAMDRFYNLCNEALNDAVEQWAKDNPSRPSLPIGATVQTPHGVGIIERIDEYRPQSYIVPIGGHRLVIAFEDVSALDGAEAGS